MKKKIILMGSDDFAIKPFEALIKSNLFQILAIYCQPDKKCSRGLKITPPIVKKNFCNYCETSNIAIKQPVNLKDSLIIDEYKSLNPDLTIVIAYGKILPKEFLEIPKFGAINIHASLLPDLRGASPIQHAILKGYSKTGITFFKLNEKCDAGDIFFQKEINILPFENSLDLKNKISNITAEIINDVIIKYLNNQLPLIKQDESKATYTKLIKKEDAKIDFNKNTKTLFNEIRAYYPWPISFAFLDEKIFKIIKAMLNQNDFEKFKDEPNGKIVDKEKGLLKCKDSLLQLIEVQIEGRKKMLWKDFILGYKKEEIILK